MKIFMIGIGAAGNKALLEAISEGVVDINDTLMINSTSKDFPENYAGKTLVISPNNTGAGKEQDVAREYAIDTIQEDRFSKIDLKIEEYTTVVILTSVEGGTGSGSTPIIAKYFNQVYNKNVYIIAFTGFEDDARGLANTVNFFKKIDDTIIVQTISNKLFLPQVSGNRFRAEEEANKEMCRRVRIISGKDFIASSQNIDDTDIIKVSNTPGYMIVEKVDLKKPLENVEDYNKIVKNMIYNTKSLRSDIPSAKRIGVILNISPESEDAIDYEFSDIKEAYGNPYELFLQKQWDGKKEYIAIIASGMKMPFDVVSAIYDKYNEESDKVNKAADMFHEKMSAVNIREEDKSFDMIKPSTHHKEMTPAEFLSNFEL